MSAQATVKLRQGTEIVCPNGHECGLVTKTVEEGTPIHARHITIEPIFAPSGVQAYVCPVCREVVARVSGGRYQVYVRDRRWVS